jgi:glycosyltransferase involved in cell wall biosynthesis
MKVLHCIPSMAGGGAERQLSYLAGGLVKLGVETHVALTRQGENYERLVRSGAVIHHIPVSNNHSPALLCALHHLIRKVRPAVIQTWLTQMDIVGGIAALWHHVPWIVTERNSAERYGKGLKDRLRLWLGSRASALVSNSATGLAFWEHHFAATARHVIGNGLPVEEIEAATVLPAAESPGNCREKLILFAGRYHPAKNLDGLIAALRLLRSQIPFKAVLCGQGPEKQALERKIVSAGLADVVLLKGYQANLWSWMKRADLFVSVSFSEGHPNTVLEAMVARCPLVVSDIPEHREFLDPTLGLLVDPADPGAISRAVADSLRDPAGARERANAAAQRATRWSIEAMSQQYLKVCQELTGTTVSCRVERTCHLVEEILP